MKFCQMSLSSRYIVLIHGWLLKGNLQVADMEIGIRELDKAYPRIYACLGRCRRVYGIFGGNQQGQMLVAESLIWVWQRSSGTGSGGADNLPMMHCWHYLKAFGSSSHLVLISGGTKAKGEQKDLLVADLNGDYQMLLVTFISLGLVISSLCHIYFCGISFMVSRSCNGLFWFPHYAWDDWCNMIGCHM